MSDVVRTHIQKWRRLAQAGALAFALIVPGAGFALLSQAHAAATISLVKEVGSVQYVNNTMVSSVSVPVPAGGVAAGDTLILMAGNSGNDQTHVASATDSRGNSYTVDGNISQVSYFENTSVVSGYVSTALQSGDNITVTFNNTASIIEVLATEWSGIASTGRVDKAHTNIATSSNLTTGNVTTTQANDLLIGSFMGNGNVVFTPGSGTTPFATQFYNHLGSVYRNQWQEYSITGNPGDYSATGTTKPSSGYAAVGVAYKAATTPPDTTPPTAPTNLAVTNSTMGSVSLNWTASTDNVGVTGYDLYLSGVPAGTTTNTSATFNGLTCGTQYGFGVDAYDAAGNKSTVTSLNASTAACDTIPPTVAMTAPANNSTVSGSSVTLSANASDNIGVTGVQFQLDGTNLGAALTTAPYSMNWDTTIVSNGQHTLTAVARDAAGNTATSSAVTVTVSNVDATPPTVNLTAPVSGAYVHGTAVALSANASDNIAVAKVQFQIDGVNVGSADTTAPYTASWNTTSVTDGQHVVTAIATDTSGNATSASETVTVDNTAPTVTMTAPANGASVTGSQPVTATASDNNAVTGVQFQLDGANLGGLQTSLPYGLTWNSAQASNGQHTLTAIAYDAAGNSKVSSAVTVTVSNTISLNAMPLISEGLPSYGDGNVIYDPSLGNDNDYGPSGGAYLCGPPCSLIIDLSSVPAAQRQQVVVSWYNDETLYYAAAINSTYYNEPKDYTIDVSNAPGGGAAPTSWTTLTSVSGNFYNGREHLLNLNGANWIRMHVTAVNGSSGNSDASFNLTVNDASNGANDTWLILGDSITQDDMGHYEPSNFMQQVSAAHPTYFPSQINGGIGGWDSESPLQADPRTGQMYIDEFLASFPGRYVSLDYGTNDANEGGPLIGQYMSNMTTLINKVIAAGKIPVLRKSIPWGCTAGIQANGPTINADLQQLLAQYPQAIAGPDEWSYFQAHQSLISGDCIHPTIGNGNAAYRQVYVQALLSGVYANLP